METLLNHTSFEKISSKIIYFFIEKDRKRIEHLKDTIAEKFPNLPQNIKIHFSESAFDESLNDMLDHIDSKNARLAPAFVMIDPFGVSDTPMSVINRIMANRKCEIYISVMYEPINRFKKSDEFEPHLNKLFGTEAWKKYKDEPDIEIRKESLFQLYRDQLKENNCKHVVYFQLYEENRLKYAIFYATNNDTGCDKMKNAIWKIAPDGTYSFKGSNSNQLVFGIDKPDTTQLKQILFKRFGEQDSIRIEDIENFVKSDETIFHTGHLKILTLTPMEKADPPQLEVIFSPRKVSRGYPPGTILRFLVN